MYNWVVCWSLQFCWAPSLLRVNLLGGRELNGNNIQRAGKLFKRCALHGWSFTERPRNSTNITKMKTTTVKAQLIKNGTHEIAYIHRELNRRARGQFFLSARRFCTERQTAIQSVLPRRRRRVMVTSTLSSLDDRWHSAPAHIDNLTTAKTSSGSSARNASSTIPTDTLGHIFYPAALATITAVQTLRRKTHMDSPMLVHTKGQKDQSTCKRLRAT